MADEIETQSVEPTVESESFSPLSADEALKELMDAMPKSKRGEFFGHFNEIAVVLARLAEKAGIAADQRHKALE